MEHFGDGSHEVNKDTIDNFDAIAHFKFMFLRNFLFFIFEVAQNFFYFFFG